MTLDRILDLRSDTVTRPTVGMRRAIAEAEVGDDVWGEDPTVAALEARAVSISGKEAAVFVLSGTMANVLAIRCQTEPGDEVLMHEGSHPLHFEAGGAAAIAGVLLKGLRGDRGLLEPDTLRAALRSTPHYMAPQRLLCLENTHNLGGGSVASAERVWALADLAHGAGLSVHVDGARIFNASVASGVPVAGLAAPADTVSFCLSKGLGAPVGSMLCGTAAFIRKARRMRHMLGGGWRQAGILAAAGLYALDHHVERLADDHRRARALGEAIEASRSLALRAPVETNIVLFGPRDGTADPEALRLRLEGLGIRVVRFAPTALRAVLHLDVSEEAAVRAAGILRDL